MLPAPSLPLDLSCFQLAPADLSALQNRLIPQPIPIPVQVNRIVSPVAVVHRVSVFVHVNRIPSPVDVVHHVGPMDKVCPHCAARFFPGESMGSCCSSGAVDLPAWRAPPEPLYSFLQDQDFRLKIRAYNCAFSLGSSVFQDLTVRTGGPATFKMAGRSWHLLPCAVQPSAEPKAAQIYTLPVGDAADRRLQILSAPGRVPLRRAVLEALHVMLLQCNALVRSFVRASTDGADWNVGCGALDPQATAENDTMIGLLVNGGGERSSVVMPARGTRSLIIVSDLDPYYQPLHFVLLFPYGDPQWGLHLDRARSNSRKRGRAAAPVSIFDYLRFHSQRRHGPADISIHSFGRLFEEWFVDCYLQQENQKLKYLLFNQSKFRR